VIDVMGVKYPMNIFNPDRIQRTQSPQRPRPDHQMLTESEQTVCRMNTTRRPGAGLMNC
jgi:hypothetical protein